MRFNHTISFIKHDDKYDPTISEHVESNEVVSTIEANVTDIGTERAAQLFGDIKQRHLVVRLIEPVQVPWSYLTIDDSDIKYTSFTSREPLHANTLIVSETNEY
ncbi:hypothetical protein [Paucilactobacillus sp. N302-9]